MRPTLEARSEVQAQPGETVPHFPLEPAALKEFILANREALLCGGP